MTSSRRTVSSILLLLLVVCCSQWSRCTATSFGLYHQSMRQAWSNCTVGRIPWNLCPACKLKSFTGKGPNLNFGGVNRFDIYEVLHPRCLYFLQRYVDFNPCDVRRRNALAKIKLDLSNKRPLNELKNDFAYKTIIYFAYSICETCCDCIPIGARVDQYEERKKKNTLINIYRGNCPAHFWYDTCKIWPNAQQITGLKGKLFNYENGSWCADFKQWQFSDNAKGWLKNNAAQGYTWKMKRAMNQIANSARCKEESVWKNCIGMELAQGRV